MPNAWVEQDDPQIGRPGLRARPLLVGLVIVLAVSAAGSTWAAVRFHQHSTRLSGLAAGHVLAKPLVVGSASASAQSASSAVVAGGGTDSPTLSSHRYDLIPVGQLRATVYLTTASADGSDSTSGQLVVSGLVRGGQAGVTYQLTGGSCEVDSQLDVVWARGVADANGTAFMTGQSRILPKADNYTLALDASPEPSSGAPGPGIEGVFVLGQASRYAGEPCN